MNEQTAKMVEQLAEKLGTTTEYLWGILIRQAPMSAFIDLVYCVLVLFMGYGLFKVHKWLLKATEDYDSLYEQFKEGAVLPMVIASLVWCILFMGCFFSIANIINGFFNPEYWALNKVLRSL